MTVKFLGGYAVYENGYWQVWSDYEDYLDCCGESPEYVEHSFNDSKEMGQDLIERLQYGELDE